MEKEEIDKNENAPEKNYYWQSFLISLILFIGFIFLLIALGVYKEERTAVGSILFILLVQVINGLLKKFAKKYGEDILE